MLLLEIIIEIGRFAGKIVEFEIYLKNCDTNFLAFEIMKKYNEA